MGTQSNQRTRAACGTIMRDSSAKRLGFLTAVILAVVSSIWCGWLARSAAGQTPRATGDAASAATPSAGATPSADKRDAVLLLDGGPLHVRMRLALGGVSLAAARQQFVSGLVQSLDANKDGRLTRDEADRSPILRTKRRPSAAQFLEGLKAESQLTPLDVQRTVERLAGELVAYRQDLSSAQYDLEIFKLLDRDASGVLEPAELQGAPDLIMSKDSDGDDCVSFQEFFPPPPAPDPLAVAVAPAPAPAPTPMPTAADLIRDVGEPLIARRLLKKYDRNRDLRLTATELGWPPARVRELDTDESGQLDAGELAILGQSTPDIELEVDLRAKDSGGGLIRVVNARTKPVQDAARPDFAKVAFEGAVLTFSHRNLDPIVAALDTAMRQFNQLDADGNGYLGRDETMERTRFERGLFDLLDADGDDKIFVDEMKQYVRARAETAGATCRVNVYDTGNGFFMALDANADGRISVRERRKAAAGLAQLERDGKAGIAEREPTRHFHIEFVRGSYQLFGPSEELLAQTPAFQQRTPTGPIWFQRMDRNNDGDLTWNEFLGPREVFHKLDANGDDLIDPQEASKAR
jgi:Ca2+-binding EF-hand superfamily protein